MEHYKEKYESLLRDIDIAIAGQKEGETKTVLQNLKERHTESENERIRKGLIHYFKEQDGILTAISGNVSTRDVLAWPGKQGEQIDAIENFDTEFEKQVSYLIASTINKEHEYNEGFVKWTANALLNYAKHELEKQGEQKSEINDNILLRFAFYQYDDDTLYLSSVFVEECNRKHGYGSKILKAAEEVAKTLGIYKVCLKVERNTWMEEWYKKNGYEYLCSEGEYDWLEKRIEQKLVDNVEPKFNVGDWLVCCNYEPEQIIGIKNNMYEMSNGDIRPINMINNNHNIRLWTIQDAKDGDVLYECNEKKPFIFKEIKTKHIGDIASYCDIFNGVFNPNEDNWTTLDIVPSTKEQCNLLFLKMKEAGYEWDNEKKELKKIEQKPAFCHHEVDLSGCSEEYRKAYYDGWNNCNQQHSQLKAEQKPAWSEEDENYRLDVNVAVNNYFDEGYAEELCGWLKSLKERYTWKPSDEQIEAVRIAAEIGTANNSWAMGVLKSMYQDLKKLKE